MTKVVNAAMIEGLTQELAGIDSCVLVGCRGLTVAEVSTLRNKLRGQQFKMRVVKNTLAARSFESVGLNGLGSLLSGPSAVVFGGEGAIAISKVLVDEAKKSKEKLVIQGGFSEGEVLDPKGIHALSTIPGRKELLGMVMGGFFGAVSDMSRNLEGLLTETQGLIEALAKKKESEGG